VKAAEGASGCAAAVATLLDLRAVIQYWVEHEIDHLESVVAMSTPPPNSISTEEISAHRNGHKPALP
jgi:hypothetical protein